MVSIPPERRLGLFVAGSGCRRGAIELQWGRRNGAEVDVLRSDVVGDVQPRIPTSPWTFLAASELRTASAGEFVRIAASPSTVPRVPVAVTAPVTYDTEQPLTPVRAEDSTLVHPICAVPPVCRQPRSLRVSWRYRAISLVRRRLPARIRTRTPVPSSDRDLYPVQRLPLTDGWIAAAGVVVYEVERRVVGATAVAPASKTQGS